MDRDASLGVIYSSCVPIVALEYLDVEVRDLDEKLRKGPHNSSLNSRSVHLFKVRPDAALKDRVVGLLSPSWDHAPK